MCLSSRFVVFILFLSSITIPSCTVKIDTEGTNPVVEVNGSVLTEGELSKAIPLNLSPSDSASFVQSYISRWVKKELLLQKAELNLTDEEKDVERLLKDYRASLLVQKYQQKLLQQKYAPKITESEILTYYESMRDNFPLQQNIIKGMYIKVPIQAPKLEAIKELYYSDKQEDEKKLETYCYQNANQFQDFSNQWTETMRLSSLMPTPIPSEGTFFKNNKLYQTQDSLFVYFVFIKEYILKQEVAPLEYVNEKVEAILLNKKRIEFIKNLEDELYQEGLEQKAIKHYN